MPLGLEPGYVILADQTYDDNSELFLLEEAADLRLLSLRKKSLLRQCMPWQEVNIKRKWQRIETDFNFIGDLLQRHTYAVTPAASPSSFSAFSFSPHCLYK